MAKRLSKAIAKKRTKDIVNSKHEKILKRESKSRPDRPRFLKRMKNFLKKKFDRPSKKNPHKSFRRSYREDYQRETEVPGIMYHIFATFKIIFKNWKLFLPFLIIAIVLNVLLVGIMDESVYVQFQNILDDTNKQIIDGEIGNVAKAGLLLLSTITTGGLSGESSEVTVVFEILVFLIIWLVTIFILRHRLADHKIKLRDGLYNAMTPMISTFVVLAIAFVQCIPILFLTIVYSAAVQTEFLNTPFYALVFFIFAFLMILISGYLLSSSLIALVAVSAPGLYPLRALHTASDLMAGRRVRFILRIIALFIAMIIVWVIVMLPLILFDLWMKTFEWTAGIPFVPICLTIMTCFTCIYITAYLYLYYRWLLDYNPE